MLDIKDLEKFLSLPPAFNAGLILEIEYALEEYDVCVGYIVKALNEYGENAYKDSAAYDEIKTKLDDKIFPPNYKIYPVLEKMRKENCKERELPRVGEIWRHFNGDKVVIEDVAKGIKDANESYVLFFVQERNKHYCVDIKTFMDKVDRSEYSADKFPQEYSFEKLQEG